MKGSVSGAIFFTERRVLSYLIGNNKDKILTNKEILILIFKIPKLLIKLA